MSAISKFLTICALVVLGLLSSCTNGSSSSGGGGGSQTSKGTLSFNSGGTLQITQGSLQQIYLQLNNSSGVTGQNVAITIDDPTIAKVAPAICTLSTTAPQCAITVYGLKNGSTALKATANGYTTVSSSTTVGNDPVYGYLGVESSVFFDPASMESGTNLTIAFSSFQAIGGVYTINVTGGLLFSSGITDSSQAFFNVSPNAPILGGANQCQVTTAQPICTISFSVPESAVKQQLTLTAQIAGVIAPNYNNSVVTAIPESTPYPGTVQITTQTSTTSDPTNATIPVAMNAPLFVNWSNVAINGSITVNLTSSNPNVVSFYNYNPGDNVNIQTESQTTCTLTYPTVLSCGLGIRALTMGSAVISATTTANNGYSYPVQNLNLTVGAQAATLRSITFTNNSTESIAIGITSGGANAYINPTTPAIIPGSPTANAKPGGGSLCGPSNPLAACPIGSSCLQGGESPVTTSVFYCYYDQPLPSCGSNCSNNYQLAPNGSTTLNISGSSGLGDPTGIIWSGNYFARTKCNATTGICENASCNGKNGGIACGPGTGGSPGVNTLAEVTFQRSHVDFYDVSIINGVNFAASFGPTTTQPLASNAFICGTAGSSQSQSGGWSQTNLNNAGLPPALWGTIATESSFPSTATIAPESATSFYRWVESSANPVVCTADNQCGGNDKCGYWVGTTYNQLSGESIINNSAATYIKHCGAPVAWLTADTIFGLNQSGTNLSTLPFNFTQSTTNPVTQQPFTVGDLQLCINNAFSSYGGQPTPTSTAGNPILACGGVSWDLESGGYITRVAQPVVTVGPTWVANVLPTINWLKQSCPTCYTYPFDDMSSTFTCQGSTAYSVTFSNFLN